MVMEVETSSTLAFLLKSSFQIEKKKTYNADHRHD